MPGQPLKQRHRIGAARGRLPLQVELGRGQFLHHRFAVIARDPQHRHIGEIRREDAVAVQRRLGRAAQHGGRGPQIRHPRDGIKHGRGGIAPAGDVDARRIHRAALYGSFHRRGQRLHTRIDIRRGRRRRSDHLPAGVARPVLPLDGVVGVEQRDGRGLGLRRQRQAEEYANCGAGEREFVWPVSRCHRFS